MAEPASAFRPVALLDSGAYHQQISRHGKARPVGPVRPIPALHQRLPARLTATNNTMSSNTSDETQQGLPPRRKPPAQSSKSSGCAHDREQSKTPGHKHNNRLNKPKTPENRQCMRTRSANESNRKVTSVNTPDNEQRTASAGRQVDGDSETTSSPATDASTLNGTSPTAAAGAGAKVRQVAPPFQVRTIVTAVMYDAQLLCIIHVLD